MRGSTFGPTNSSRSMLMLFRPVIFLIFLTIATNVLCQTTEHRFSNWFTYFGHYRLNKHWGIHTDLQFRTDGRVHRTNQSLLRIGGQYLLSPTTNLTLGYALIGNYSSVAYDYFTEHRLWQQYLHTAHLSQNTSMTHRLRLEERWAGYAGGRDGWRCGFRLRYFNRTIIHFSSNTSASVRPYLALQNELFLNSAAREINPNLFDQNRLLIAIGVLNHQHTRLEVGYMNQYLNPPGNTDIVHHVLHLSLLQVLDFYSTE